MLSRQTKTRVVEHSPKRMNRLVREWAAVAHDRELAKALRDLRSEFDRWQRGEIGAAALNDLIHRFHDGASREIWKRYATNRLEPALAWAVSTGILRRDELPAELLRHIAGLVEFYESDQEDARGPAYTG